MFYVNNSRSHNKYWAYDMDDKTNEVHVSWGRLGTKGQNKSYKFPNRWKALEFVETKEREKIRKGYSLVEEEEFNLKHIQANLVGAGCKIFTLKFVELKNQDGKDSSEHFTTATEESVLANPHNMPLIFCSLQFRKGTMDDAENDSDVFEILISEDEIKLIESDLAYTKIIDSGWQQTYTYKINKVIDEFDWQFNKIYKIAPKLVQAIFTKS